MRLDGFDLFIGICVIAFFAFIGYNMYRYDTKVDKCRDIGGVVVQTAEGSKCLNLKTLEIK